MSNVQQTISGDVGPFNNGTIVVIVLKNMNGVYTPQPNVDVILTLMPSGGGSATSTEKTKADGLAYFSVNYPATISYTVSATMPEGSGSTTRNAASALATTGDMKGHVLLF